MLARFLSPGRTSRQALQRLKLFKHQLKYTRPSSTGTMLDAQVRKQYLADDPPTVVQLQIRTHFEALTDKQKKYAHYVGRAAWYGTRVVLRQISPESEPIYDFILSLYHASQGDWKDLGAKTGVSAKDVSTFVDYAAQFLGNGGNYKGFGDSKFIPRVGEDVVEKLASITEETKKAYEKVKSTGGGMYETSETGLMHLGYLDQGHMT